jgi:hypothetical protein
MGVVPARDPGPGKVKLEPSILRTRNLTPTGVFEKKVRFAGRKSDTPSAKSLAKPMNGTQRTQKRLVPSCTEPQECVVDSRKRTKDGHKKTRRASEKNSL